MITATQINLRTNYQTDKLLETLEIELTDEQQIYLQENKSEKRTLLLKKFNLQFGTKHTKLQLTRAIEVMNEPKFKPTGERKRNNMKIPKNIYWISRRKRWLVQFRIDGVCKSCGYFKEFKDAKKVADLYRQNLA